MPNCVHLRMMVRWKSKIIAGTRCFLFCSTEPEGPRALCCTFLSMCTKPLLSTSLLQNNTSYFHDGVGVGNKDIIPSNTVSKVPDRTQCKGCPPAHRNKTLDFRGQTINQAASLHHAVPVTMSLLVQHARWPKQHSSTILGFGGLK